MIGWDIILIAIIVPPVTFFVLTRAAALVGILPSKPSKLPESTVTKATPEVVDTTLVIGLPPVSKQDNQFTSLPPEISPLEEFTADNFYAFNFSFAVFGAIWTFLASNWSIWLILISICISISKVFTILSPGITDQSAQVTLTRRVFCYKAHFVKTFYLFILIPVAFFTWFCAKYNSIFRG